MVQSFSRLFSKVLTLSSHLPRVVTHPCASGATSSLPPRYLSSSLRHSFDYVCLAVRQRQTLLCPDGPGGPYNSPSRRLATSSSLFRLGCKSQARPLPSSLTTASLLLLTALLAPLSLLFVSIGSRRCWSISECATTRLRALAPCFPQNRRATSSVVSRRLRSIASPATTSEHLLLAHFSVRFPPPPSPSRSCSRSASLACCCTPRNPPSRRASRGSCSSGQ